MIMENASLERIPSHIFFWKKDLVNLEIITWDYFFYTVPFQIISQCLIFPVLGTKLSETSMISISGNGSWQHKQNFRFNPLSPTVNYMKE